MSMEDAVVLTLAAAQAIAADSNPTVLVARYAISAAHGAKLQGQALSDPALVLDVEGEDGQAFGSQRYGVVQVLEFPGKYGLRGAIGADQVEIQRHLGAVVRAAVQRQVAGPYYRLARETAAGRRLALIDTLLAQLGEITTARYRAGDASYSDVVRIQVERARLRAEIITASQRARDARSDLDLVLGRPPDSPLSVPDDALTFEPLGENQEQVVEERMSSSHTLRIAELEQSRRSKQLDLAQRSNLPDFEVGAFWQRVPTPGGGDFLSGELSVSVPLWRTRQNGQVEAARAERDAAGIQRVAVRRRVHADILRAYSATESAASRVELYRRQLLPEVEDGVQAAIDAYRYGRVNALEVVDLLRSAEEARLQYLTALQEYLTQRAELALSGELTGLSSSDGQTWSTGEIP
jgi:cobalt-zinc-cadmium efflux system outer membrane protein